MILVSDCGIGSDRQPVTLTCKPRRQAREGSGVGIENMVSVAIRLAGSTGTKGGTHTGANVDISHDSHHLDVIDCTIGVESCPSNPS